MSSTARAATELIGVAVLARPRRVAGLALLLCSVSANCLAELPGAHPVRGGTLTVGLSYDLDTLNVYSTGFLGDVEASVVEGLIAPDDHAHYVPVLATSVPTIENGGIQLHPDGGMTVTYHLRRAVTWQDGAPFTSAGREIHLGGCTRSRLSRGIQGWKRRHRRHRHAGPAHRGCPVPPHIGSFRIDSVHIRHPAPPRAAGSRSQPRPVQRQAGRNRAPSWSTRFTAATMSCSAAIRIIGATTRTAFNFPISTGSYSASFRIRTRWKSSSVPERSTLRR